MQVMERHSLRNPVHSSSGRHIWNQTHGQNKGRPVHSLHKWAADRLFPGYEPFSSVSDPGCTSCAIWVRASWVPLQSVPSTAQQIDFTRHNSSLLQIEWLICFCTTSVDLIFFFFSLGLINTQKLRKAGLTLKGYACLTISGASSWFGALLCFASGKSHDKRWLSPGLSVACCMQAGGTIRLKGSSFLIVFHLL